MLGQVEEFIFVLLVLAENILIFVFLTLLDFYHRKIPSILGILLVLTKIHFDFVLEMIDWGEIVELFGFKLHKLIVAGFTQIRNLSQKASTALMLRLNLPSIFLLHFLYLLGFLFDRTVFDIIVFLDERVESVFNFIFRSASEMFADFWPFPANRWVKHDNFAIFLISPFFSFDFGIQFIYESFSYLLACLSTQHLG